MTSICAAWQYGSDRAKLICAAIIVIAINTATMTATVMLQLANFVGVVPEAGLEPARRKARDFESLVSTIPPLGHWRRSRCN